MPQRSAIYHTRKVLATVFGFVGKEIVLWGGAAGTIGITLALVLTTDLRWWQIALMVPLWWIGIWLAGLPFLGLAMLLDPTTEEDIGGQHLSNSERAAALTDQISAGLRRMSQDN